MNKKGASLNSWIVASMFSVSFLIIFGVAIANLNLIYGQNYNVGFTDKQNTTQLFVEYSNTSYQKVLGGEVNFNSDAGITLKTSWGIITDALTIVWSLLSGGWIQDIIQGLNLGNAGDVLAIVLQTLYVISLIGAILYTLFKVNT